MCTLYSAEAAAGPVPGSRQAAHYTAYVCRVQLCAPASRHGDAGGTAGDMLVTHWANWALQAVPVSVSARFQQFCNVLGLCNARAVLPICRSCFDFVVALGGKQHSKMLALTLISHEASQHGEKQTDPAPRYPSCLEYERLSAVYSSSGVTTTMSKVCLMSGVLNPVPTVFSTLNNLVGALQGKTTLEVAISRAGGRVMRPALDKDVRTSRYHLRQPAETLIRKMDPQDVLQSALSWKQQVLTLTVPISLAQLPLELSTNHTGATLHATTAIDVLMHPMHYAQHPRMLIQLSGRIRVLVVAPHHAFAGLYPFPVHHAYDGYSMVDFDCPEWKQRWPMADTVRGAVATLRPGYGLYVPPYTFCSIQSLDTYCSYADVTLQQADLLLMPWSPSLAAGLGPLTASAEAPIGPSPWAFAPLSAAAGAAALAVSRAVEAIMADAAGDVDAVRAWLLRAGVWYIPSCVYQGRDSPTAAGEEARHADVMTVAGYRVLMACHQVRGLIEAWFGRGAARSLLLAMCEGRLLPTTWLGASGLLLHDHPKVVRDSRSDIQRRFPMFFKHAGCC